VEQVLTLAAGDVGDLESPVLVVALEGWFDMAGAATRAVDELFAVEQRVIVGEIDPDPFYDFTVERPFIEVVDGALRQIRWARNEFSLWRAAGAGRDVVLLLGVEPHLAWPTYCDAVLEVVDRLGCQVVVTVGSGAEAVPHSRTPMVTGSSSNVELARRLGLSSPSYQGVTGLVGVLHPRLEAAGVASVSLRVGVPHYLANTSHPIAVDALQRHLGHVLGVGKPVDLGAEIAQARAAHDDIVANDPQLAMYVAMLEREYDRRSEAMIPTADDLGAEFEAFLAGLDDTDPDPPGADPDPDAD
jgi:proteasome assembly chaperone (PAC2) family protein